MSFLFVMNYLIDTCVLFPTVMRTILLDAVKSKHDSAFWSEKILSEWSASAKKVGELGQLQADAEISILRANSVSYTHLTLQTSDLV